MLLSYNVTCGCWDISNIFIKKLGRPTWVPQCLQGSTLNHGDLGPGPLSIYPERFWRLCAPVLILNHLGTASPSVVHLQCNATACRGTDTGNLSIYISIYLSIYLYQVVNCIILSEGDCFWSVFPQKKQQINKMGNFICQAFKMLSETTPGLACAYEMKKSKLCHRAEPNMSLERSWPGE